MVFGKLTVRYLNDAKRDTWACKCECGHYVNTTGRTLLSGNRTACTTCDPERVSGKFGIAVTTGNYCFGPRKEENKLGAAKAFRAARAACLRPKHVNWPICGGRGIEFRFKSFEEFFEELGERPKGKILDRIDSNGHFEKGNVRWVPPWAAIHNRRIYGDHKYRGVYQQGKNHWIVAFTRNYKTYRFDGYRSEEEAAHAWDKIAPKYFGEYTNLNFPPTRPQRRALAR